MTREMAEQAEYERLSTRAAKSAESVGRDVAVQPDPYRTDFQRDRDRILHCKAFRRLSHKTQVFLAPEGDHYRTRLTHTLEVAQIARSISRTLRLNEDLTEAIALGHDLGHTPFGHTGESALDDALAEVADAYPDAPRSYRHNVQSLRIVERLEYDGKGLNLTREVRDGIIGHTGGSRTSTSPSGPRPRNRGRTASYGCCSPTTSSTLRSFPTSSDPMLMRSSFSRSWTTFRA